MAQIVGLEEISQALASAGATAVLHLCDDAVWVMPPMRVLVTDGKPRWSLQVGLLQSGHDSCKICGRYEPHDDVTPEGRPARVINGGDVIMLWTREVEDGQEGAARLSDVYIRRAALAQSPEHRSRLVSWINEILRPQQPGPREFDEPTAASATWVPVF